MIRRAQGSVFVVALLGAVALVGCSSHQRLATQAVDFNRAVEKAQNEMLLLNVIRAKERLPMYLTGMSSLSGNIQTTLTASVGGSYSRALHPVGGRSTDSLTRGLTPSAGATVSENPTYTLAVLDTQEFMRGFLSPVAKETLAYYWNQGWPPELLLYLLVNRVELVRQVPSQDGELADGPKIVLKNYPKTDESKVDDPNVLGMPCFGRWLSREFLARRPQVDTVPQPEDIGPPLPADKVMDLADLVKAAKEGLVLKKDETTNVFQLQRNQSDIRFKLEKDAAGEKGAESPECEKLEEFLAQKDDFKIDKAQRDRYLKESRPDSTQIVMVSDSMKINFVLRSPEALLYYLGELTRMANNPDNPRVPYVCIQERFQPLFVAFPGGKCPDALLSADSGQGTYSIPPLVSESSSEQCAQLGELILKDPRKDPSACNAGRSMQALRLLSQVMSLQKSAKDLPSTALVRVIGE